MDEVRKSLSIYNATASEEELSISIQLPEEETFSSTKVKTKNNMIAISKPTKGWTFFLQLPKLTRLQDTVTCILNN